MQASSNDRWHSAWLLPLAIAVVSGLLAWACALDPRWHDVLDYRRAAVAAGEAWRLITAHLMHLSIEHAVLDVAGLGLVAWIFAAELGWRLQALVSVVAIVFIDTALWVLRIDRYVGLSGVLHAWFAMGAVGWLLAARDDALRPQGRDAALRRRLWGAVLSIGLCAKLVLESHHQAFWHDGTAFPVVTSAHRWGALAGVVCGLGAAAFRRRAGTIDAGRVSRAR